MAERSRDWIAQARRDLENARKEDAERAISYSRAILEFCEGILARQK